MKVVLLTADYPPNVWSGIGHAVHRQAVDLAALGVAVTVVAPGAPAPADSRANPHVVRLRSDGSMPAIDDADWVHVHGLALTELALWLRRACGARLACTVHTQPWLELTGHPHRRFWLDAQARLLASCDAVIFLSAAERASGETLFSGLPPVHVIPHGVPPPPPDVPGRSQRQVVIFAGRCAASKGLSLLAECIRRVRRLSDLRFVLATGHGDAVGAGIVARLLREHGAACDVAGWLSRQALDDRLAHAVLALVPSRYEPFGLVALEAMRLGTPVVGARVGGLRETLRDGSGGILLDGTDPDQWAHTTVRVAGDAEEWSRLHHQGRAFVRTFYQGSDVAARLLGDVYRAGARLPVRASTS